jgi:hypothetical protein
MARELHHLVPSFYLGRIFDPKHGGVRVYERRGGDITRPALARGTKKLMAPAADNYTYSSTAIPGMAKYPDMPRMRILYVDQQKSRIFDQD